MPESLPDFRPLLAALNARHVRFVIIGGLAMVAHGSAYITQDMDLGYARDRQNLQALADALASAHPRLRNFPPDLPFFWDARTLSATSNLWKRILRQWTCLEIFPVSIPLKACGNVPK